MREALTSQAQHCCSRSFKYSYNISSLPQSRTKLDGHSCFTCAYREYLPGIECIANSHAAAKAQAVGPLPAPWGKMLRTICWGAILDESETSPLD